MKKRTPIVLTDEMILQWKQSTVDYLKGLYKKPLNELGYALMSPGFLRPQFKRKGSFLLEPNMLVNEAWYLRKGLAMLYAIESKTGSMNGYYIWEADSIIVLYEAFIEQLPNEAFYIELIEDSELVSVSNFTMGGIYKEHTVAHVLTQKILSKQIERRGMQCEILMMPKLERPAALDEKFPNLKGRLSSEQICAFIGIKPSTLGYAKNGG
nr:hypothetical protein [Pedobacter panaciterrae]